MAEFDRAAELRELYAIARASIDEAPADKRAPLIARAESLAATIDAIESEASEKAGDPIDEIAARRSARGGATSRLGKTAGR